MFTEDIIGMANNVAKNMGIVFIVTSLHPVIRGPLFTYYWKSKYALNRSIIALQILK